MSRYCLLKVAASLFFLLSVCSLGLLAQESKRGSSPPVLAVAKRPNTNWNYYLLSQLAHNPVLIKQLELSDGQQRELKSAAEEMRAEQTELTKKYREAYKTGNYQQAQAEYMKSLGDFQTRFVDGVGEVLLDCQMKRLNQISRQQQAAYSRGNWSSTSRYFSTQDMLEIPFSWQVSWN